VTTAKPIRQQGSVRGRGWPAVADTGWPCAVGCGLGWRAFSMLVLARSGICGS